MTLTELRKLNMANGGHFFARKTMQHFGDTMSNYRLIDKGGDIVYVERMKATSKGFGPNRWAFRRDTGRTWAAPFRDTHQPN